MNRPVAGHTENETFEESAILPVRGRHAGLQDFAERRCSSAGESITPTFRGAILRQIAAQIRDVLVAHERDWHTGAEPILHSRRLNRH
jgi:hypothetical protein